MTKNKMAEMDMRASMRMFNTEVIIRIVVLLAVLEEAIWGSTASAC